MTEPPHAGGRASYLFPTPVIIDELDDATQLNAELEAAILAQMKSDPGLRMSNQGGWQSKHNLPAWAGAAGQRVLDRASALATANTTTARGDGVAWTIDAWANVNANGASNRAHVHGGSYWSAVYYVRVGDGNGGALTLHDPRMPALRMHAPALRFKDCGSEIFALIRPTVGLMVLFPAWLSHSVEPWDGTESRISIAMNIRAVPAVRRSGTSPLATADFDEDN